MPIMQVASIDPAIAGYADLSVALGFSLLLARMLLGELREERSVRRLEADARIAEAHAALETARTLQAQFDIIKELSA